MIFTTSWDDGYRDDLRVAKILDHYKVKGTFYVCPTRQHGLTPLTEQEICMLATHHEIGAHTMTHPKLTAIPQEKAQREIHESKLWIEKVTGKPCTMFCYPYGDFNDVIVQHIREAGFWGARTVEQYKFRTESPFLLPTSLHIYPFPLRPVWNRHALDPLRNALPTTRMMNIPFISLRSWSSFAKALFRSAYEQGKSWFHLWGHSAEIYRYDMERDLEVFLAYIRSFSNVDYVPNSSLVS